MSFPSGSETSHQGRVEIGSRLSTSWKHSDWVMTLSASRRRRRQISSSTPFSLVQPNERGRCLSLLGNCRYPYLDNHLGSPARSAEALDGKLHHLGTSYRSSLCRRDRGASVHPRPHPRELRQVQSCH